MKIFFFCLFLICTAAAFVNLAAGGEDHKLNKRQGIPGWNPRYGVGPVILPSGPFSEKNTEAINTREPSGSGRK